MLGGKIILVVEDGPTTLKYLEVQLQKQGAKVSTVSTGEEEFEKADQSERSHQGHPGYFSNVKECSG